MSAVFSGYVSSTILKGKEGRSHGWQDNRRALFTIHINMWTVSSDDSIQRRHWQPLSIHLWAYCTHPTYDVNDVGRNNDIHKSTHLSCFLNCLYSRSHSHRQSTIVLDHECMWRFASYYWNIAWGFGFLCTVLFLCKKKWKTFNPVTPKRAPQHKSNKISHVIQQKFWKTRNGCFQNYLWSVSLHNRTLKFNSQLQNLKIDWAGKIHFFALLGCVASFSDIYNIVIACTTTLSN